MACLFDKHLTICFNDATNSIDFMRCCWSSCKTELSLKEFFKIKDIIEYGSKISLVENTFGMCNENDCSKMSSSIENVQVSLLKACNLNCYHCFNTVHKDSSIRIKLNTYCLNKLRSHNLNTLRLSGSGEIFVYYDSLITYLKSLNTQDFKNIKFFTNGNLLSDERLEELKNISIQTGVNYIFSYSVDAVTKETYEKIRIGGDFNKVLQNIKKTISLFSKNNVFLMFTIKKPNREEAKLYHQFYKELFGFEDTHIGMNFDTLNKENDIDKKIYQELKVNNLIV